MLSPSRPKDQNGYARKLIEDLFKSKMMLIKRLIAGRFEEEALKEISRLRENKNIGGDHYIKIAECYCLLERFKEALEILLSIENNIGLLEKLRKKDNLSRLNLLGLTYKHLKESKKAVEKWKIGLQIDPHCNLILNNMGNYYNHKNELEQAVHYYWKCKKRNSILNQIH